MSSADAETDDADPPDPSGAVLVVHEDGYDVFKGTAPDADKITRFVDSLPGDPPDAAAFNADAHPDHPAVGMLDDAHPALEIEATLREYRADLGLEEVDDGE